MGFFASLFGKKPSPFTSAASAPHSAEPTAPAVSADAAGSAPAETSVFGSPEVTVRPPGVNDTQPEIDVPALLAEARERLDMKDLPAALQLYERLANADIDMTEPLTRISGDLGATGHIQALIEFVAPRYDPRAHGFTPGINLIQAFLHERLPVPALQLVDILRPAVTTYSMRDRLDGFRTAAEQMRSELASEPANKPVEGANVGLINISRPIWSYSLPQGENLLPTKNHRVRAIAMLPIALWGDGIAENTIAPPNHPLAGIARGLPMALAEACWYSPAYRPVAVSGIDPAKNLLLIPNTFRGEQIAQLFPKDQEPLDFAVTGGLRSAADGTIGTLEFGIWDMRKTKLIKSLRAEGPEALTILWPQLLGYLEAAKPGPAPLEYALPVDPVGHAQALDHVLHFFLLEKGVLPAEKVAPHGPRLAALARYAEAHATSAVPRLALFSALHHCQKLRLPIPPEATATAERLSAS